MADNVAITAGTGTTVATDDVGGVHYQLVKNVFGALDTATLVTPGAGLPVAPQFTELASLTAGSLNADLVPSTDVSAYKSISVHVTTAATGTLTFQCSNDNSTWATAFVTNPGGGNATIATTVATGNTGVYTGSVYFRYFRVRMTAYTSGTAAGVCELSAAPAPLLVSYIDTAIAGTVTVNSELPAAATLADASANPSTPQVGSAGETFNGTTWDRQRGNVDVAVLASGARTTTQTGADTTNYNGRGVKVVLDTTVASAGSVTLSIQGKDANGVYYTLLTGTAVTTVSTVVYTLYPGATAAANLTVNDVLPRVWRVVVTANNASTQTYSVSSCVIL